MNNSTPQQEKQPTPLEVHLLDRREVLLLELRKIERQLGIKPTVRALCPSCLKERNKAA